MPWFLTPHGPHFVVEPGTVDEYERRDYTPLTSQQVTDYYAGVAIPEPSFATEAEVPGIVAGAVAAGTGPVSSALKAAFAHLDEDGVTLVIDGIPVGGGGGGGGGLTTEQIQDLVAAMVVDGANVTKTYDDTTGTLTIDVTSPPDATAAVKGLVELATTTETVTGTDAVRAVTPSGMAASLTRRGPWETTGLKWTTGRRYAPPGVVVASSSLAFDQLLVTRMPIAEGATISTVTVRTNAAGSAQNIDLTVYDADGPDGDPGTLLFTQAYPLPTGSATLDCAVTVPASAGRRALWIGGAIRTAARTMIAFNGIGWAPLNLANFSIPGPAYRKDLAGAQAIPATFGTPTSVGEYGVGFQVVAA